MILAHIRVCTAWNRFYHAMIIKKEDEPAPNFYASVFMAWDEDSAGNSKYKRHFRGTSEENVMKQFSDFLKQMDGKEITNVQRY